MKMQMVPADVNGSYAVYHKTKRNHIIGQTNYMTGKFGHIYCPRFMDANGYFVWGELNIKDGIYTITIPQLFLDKAVYPVKANDTFGYTTVGGTQNTSASTGSMNFIRASSTPTFNGSLTSLSVYGRTRVGSPTFNPAIYSNVSSLPSARLAYLDSGGTAYGASDGWITTNLSYASIVAGTQYWLCFMTGVNAVQNYYYEDAGAANDTRWINAQPTAYPDPAGSDGGEPSKTSIYATYTASGGAETFLTGVHFYDF
jgi:hypothetical protein